MLLRLPVALSIALVLLGSAQRKEPTGVIIGRVVEGLSTTSVRDAEVSLVGTAEPNAKLNAMTDGEGNFVFFNVPAGPYWLRASKRGYWFGEYGQRRAAGIPRRLTLSDGQRVGNVVVSVWPSATVSGTVRDEASEPVVGVAVQAINRGARSGRLYAWNTSNYLARTDDRGMYRLAGLAAGDYLISIPDREVPLLLPPGIVAGDPVAVTTAAGVERRGVDLQMSVAQLHRVAGRVMAVPAGIGVQLIRPDDRFIEDAVVAETVTRADGSFAFHAVPSGSYAVRVLASSDSSNSIGFAVAAAGAGPPPRAAPTASTGGRWAHAPVLVADADVQDLAVTLRPGLHIDARIVFEGSASKPSAQQLDRLFLLPFSLTNGRNLSVMGRGRVQPDADGRFTSVDLPAGQYALQFPAGAVPAGWALASMTHRGRDVLDESIKLETEDVTDIVVTFTDKVSEIAGSVRKGGNDDPDRDASVLVFPADPNRWIDFGIESPRMRLVRVQDDGSYSVKGLPAGDYLIIAIDDAYTRDWQTQDVLKRLAPNARRLTIALGAKQNLDLRTSPIR